MEKRSAFLIGAAHSGSGKTLLTLGLLRALSRRGVLVKPFKCGPDFIDPTLHELAAGKHSINLDLSMMGEHGCKTAYARHIGDSSAIVVEGVMGLFDGGSASSGSLAHCLDIPVILVIDVRSAAESVAAVIKGFEVYDPHLKIAGVICNRVGSDRHRTLIEDAVRANCRTEVLGFFSRNNAFSLPSRHLGLHMGHELTEADRVLDELARSVEEQIDLDRLIEVTTVTNVSSVLPPTEPTTPNRCRLAVARDEAFCFYYQENFDILRSCGFDLVEFSPLHDTSLPEHISGIYLGGGYPELYAEKLAANIEMKTAIRKFADTGGFVYGECGGFMYMTRELVDLQGRHFPMSAIFDVKVQMKDRLSRLGYRQPSLHLGCILGDAGERYYGHEFHYSDITYRNSAIEPLYILPEGKFEGCRVTNALGSYIHLHFARSHAQLKRLCEMLQQQEQY